MSGVALHIVESHRQHHRDGIEEAKASRASLGDRVGSQPTGFRFDAELDVLFAVFTGVDVFGSHTKRDVQKMASHGLQVIIDQNSFFASLS